MLTRRGIRSQWSRASAPICTDIVRWLNSRSCVMWFFFLRMLLNGMRTIKFHIRFLRAIQVICIRICVYSARPQHYFGIGLLLLSVSFSPALPVYSNPQITAPPLFIPSVPFSAFQSSSANANPNVIVDPTMQPVCQSGLTSSRAWLSDCKQANFRSLKDQTCSDLG